MDVIKEAIREGHREFNHWVGLKLPQQKPILMEGLAEGKLELCLAVSLDRFLLHLLMAQGLTYNVLVVKMGENTHTITVYAEKETCCTLQLIWGVSFEAKVVLLDSLEQLAGLAVAKALGVRGEEGLEELDCAGKQKEVVRLLMDKQLQADEAVLKEAVEDVVEVVEDLVEKVVMLFMDRREGGEIASTVGDGDEESDNCVKGDLLGSVSNR